MINEQTNKMIDIEDRKILWNSVNREFVEIDGAKPWAASRKSLRSEVSQAQTYTSVFSQLWKKPDCDVLGSELIVQDDDSPSECVNEHLRIALDVRGNERA